MTVFYLFRLKIHYGSQLTFFREDITREEFFYNLIYKKPSLSSQSNYVWHIGNVKKLNDKGLLFAIGRETQTSKERYDQTTGDFVEEFDERAPYTYCIFDVEHSVLAIAHNSKLSNSVKIISNQLINIFNNHTYTKSSNIFVELDEINDPTTFIEQIRSAYAITSYTAEFSLPNPFDVMKDFHYPMERFLGEAQGRKGSTNIQGQDLDKEVLENVTRSIASTGNNANARIKKHQSAKPIKKDLKKNFSTVNIDFIDIAASSIDILDKIKQKYKEIRGL